MKISAVVCTYNRAALLPVCLDSLAGQTAADSLYEVLVIDNNSNDDTFAVAEKYACRHPNFRIIFEPSQGLACARNRGWREARGEYVAYIDDDARASENWIAEICAFTERHPDTQAFGGPYEAFCAAPLPDWYRPSWGSWSLGAEERPIRIGREWLNGTNMVFARVLLEDTGGFDRALGMKGGRISYGEETRLLLDIDRKGLPVYYAPKVRVAHLISESKLRLGSLLRSAYLNGFGSRNIFDHRRSLASHLGGLLLTSARGLKCLVPDGSCFKTRLYDHCAPFCYELGAFAGFFLDRDRNA